MSSNGRALYGLAKRKAYFSELLVQLKAADDLLLKSYDLNAAEIDKKYLTMTVRANREGLSGCSFAPDLVFNYVYSVQVETLWSDTVEYSVLRSGVSNRGLTKLSQRIEQLSERITALKVYTEAAGIAAYKRV